MYVCLHLGFAAGLVQDFVVVVGLGFSLEGSGGVWCGFVGVSFMLVGFFLNYGSGFPCLTE